MKKITLFFLLLIVHFHLFAQDEAKPFPIAVGYYGPYAIQPGIKIGTQFQLKTLGDTESADAPVNIQQSLYIAPEVGLFTRINNHTSFVINADFGYKRKKLKNNFYLAPSVGLGYLTAFQILSSTIDLGTGEVIDRDRERRAYILPTINFGFGKDASSKLGWYGKVSYGRKMSTELENSGFFAIEGGVKFNLGCSTSQE